MLTLNSLLSSLGAAVRRTIVIVALFPACHSAVAQITVSGIADKTTYTGSATFTVVTAAGYQYSATLNNNPVPVGTAVRVAKMDYYDLCVARTNTTNPADFATNLVRFIVIASDRGSPEKGLIKWTPYPLINSTEAEWAGAHLEIMTPLDYPMNLPIPVVARAEDVQGQERRANGFVTAAGFANQPLKLLRGHGSVFLPPATVAGPLAYNAQLFSMQAPKVVHIEDETVWIEVSGVLSANTSWPVDSRIFITGHLTVPAGLTATFGAGTIVKLNPLVNITNNGSFVVNGTPERPVVFTSTNVVYPEKNAGAWGGFLLRGSSAQLVANGAIFTGGGGASSFSFSPGASHRSEQAVFLVHSGARASLTNCAIINTAGQIANGYIPEITFDHCLIQRAITCGEYAGGGTVIFNHSAVIEFPEDDGVINASIADADYDGIYFTEGTHIILNSLVGFAKDDALDSGSGGAGTMMVSNCWVESALHEAHAWSGGGRQARSYDTVLMNSGQGLECGYSSGDNTPLVYAERVLSTANGVGARIGDNYDWDYRGFLHITNSMMIYNYRDVFLKTWNAVKTGWDTNSWVDRVQQTRFGTNLVTTPDPRFPSNSPYDPATHGAQLAHYMTTPADAPVGIGLALRTNRFSLSQITNEIPVRLSSFTTRFVSVQYVVLGASGQVAAGSLEFAPGETLKIIPAVIPAANEQAMTVVLKNPVNGELTSISQAWYFATGQESGALVAQGSRWNYLDTGEDAGTAWRDLDYADGTWLEGNAQLGFNDGDEATTIRRTTSGGVTIITHYFRQKFVVPNPSIYSNLSLWLLRDDGGVVYLNGTEVFRSDSMPPAPTTISYSTLANNLGSSAPPDNTVDRATVAASYLVPGTNIVAVEIHQHRSDSSDTSFDFALTGNTAVAVSGPIIQQSPTNQTVAVGGTAVFSVVATGAEPIGFTWWRNQNELFDWIGPVLTLPNVTPDQAGAYHVVAHNKDGSTLSQPATLTVLLEDSDGDGMADDWELAHNLIVGVDDATLDPDGDGMSNIREFQAGTDPQDPASFLKFDTISPDIGGVVNISFFAVAGKTYRVLYTDTLTTATWHSLTNFIANRSDRVVTFQDSSRANGTERYYRLQTPAGP